MKSSKFVMLMLALAITCWSINSYSESTGLLGSIVSTDPSVGESAFVGTTAPNFGVDVLQAPRTNQTCTVSAVTMDAVSLCRMGVDAPAMTYTPQIELSCPSGTYKAMTICPLVKMPEDGTDIEELKALNEMRETACKNLWGKLPLKFYFYAMQTGQAVEVTLADVSAGIQDESCPDHYILKSRFAAP